MNPTKKGECKKLAVAVMAALATSAAVAQEPLIPLIKDAVNTSNLRMDLGSNDPDDLRTYIYSTTSTAGADYNGYLLIDVDEGGWPPGLRSYTVPFKAKGTILNGCIMGALRPEVPLTETCKADPGEGKRYKLYALKQNVQFDLVWDLNPDTNDVGGEDSGKGSSQTDTSGILKYKIFGKLVNGSQAGATSFAIRLGTGLGKDFKLSAATDWMKLGPPADDEKLGKFPGGMFGGSVAEGLPFFSTERASFEVIQDDPDVLRSGPMPEAYTSLFGPYWLRLADVPEAWWYETDGKPWTKSEIQAWYDKYDDGFADGWYTMTKSWTSTDRNLILANFRTTPGGEQIDLNSGNVPSELFPPEYEYADIEKLTALLNDLTGRTGLDPEAKGSANHAYKEQDVVEAFLPYLVLTRDPVSDATRAAWASQPVTLRYNDTWAGTNPSWETAQTWPAVATWMPQCKYTDPAYVYTSDLFSFYAPYRLEAGYAAYPEIAAIAKPGVRVKCGNDPETTMDILRVEDVQKLVKNNTGNASDADEPGAPDADIFAVPGYYSGQLEDVAKVNLYHSIAFNKPLLAEAGATTFTLGITLGTPPPASSQTLADQVLAPITGGGGGCTTGGSGPVDPTLPALLAGALVLLGLRRRAAR
jgi:hypothetical protein